MVFDPKEFSPANNSVAKIREFEFENDEFIS